MSSFSHQQQKRPPVDKGKAVVPPSGNGHFLSFHGKAISIDFIPRPRGGPGDFQNCVYVITSNLSDHHNSHYEYHGSLHDLWTMREKGYYALLSAEGFKKMVCGRLHVADCDVASVRTAVRMSPRSGWQSIDSLSEQVYKYKDVYLDDKQQHWFIAWYFHFPEGTKVAGSRGPYRESMKAYRVHLQDHRHRHHDQIVPAIHEGPVSFRRDSSSGAASDETVWPSFPFQLKPLPPRLQDAEQGAMSRQTSSSRRRRGSSSNKGENLAPKVSKIPKFIAKSLSSPTSTTNTTPPTRLLTKPEASERRTILTQLAFELKDGGINDLNGLLPVTKSPSPHQWRVCCQLLPHLDPDQLAAHPQARAIGLLGSKLAVSAFQLWTAYQILLGGSGFLAHGMGLGKTHCVLAAVALKALIAGSKKRCEEFWAMQSTRSRSQVPRHLPKHAMANAGSNLACLSQRPGDVQCWCVPGGVTRQLGESLVPGASVISVPSDLMSDWVSALVQADFKPSCYNFVVLGGSEVPPHLRQDLSFLMVKFKMSASTLATQATVKTAFDLAWTSRTSLEAAGTYVFLTSHYNPMLNDTFRYRARDLGMLPNVGPKFETGSVYGAPIGLHFIDEAHLPGVWTPTHYPMVMARRHKHIVGCDVWFVSGTPFPKDSLCEVRAQVALLNPELTPVLERLNERYKDARYKLSPNKIHRFIRDFQTLFNHNLVLRFLDTTLFFDRPITGVQNVEPQIISRCINPSSVLPLMGHKMGGRVSRKQVQRLVHRLQTLLPPHLPYVERLERKKQVADALYFISLFPAAASFLNKHDNLAIHDEAIRESIKTLDDRRHVAELPIVQEYWERFCKDSPKIQFIREEMDRVGADVSVRPGGKAGDGSYRKKCVILTPTLATAVFLHAWFVNNDKQFHVHGINPVMYHRDLSKRDKMLIRDIFNQTTPARYYKNYFIACIEDAGTGLNLQAANYQILTSPLPRASDQAQAFRRTNRTGQYLPLVHKVLVLEDNPIDRINLVDQARRRFKSDPFDVLSRGGTVELWPVTSPASESSQEDLALVAGVRPVLKTGSLILDNVEQRDGEDDLHGAR